MIVKLEDDGQDSCDIDLDIHSGPPSENKLIKETIKTNKNDSVKVNVH